VTVLLVSREPTAAPALNATARKEASWALATIEMVNATVHLAQISDLSDPRDPTVAATVLAAIETAVAETAAVGATEAETATVISVSHVKPRWTQPACHLPLPATP
jgi:hypothetical protein